VLAVYSAGNLQTMEAARQFDDPGGGRRRPMPPSVASAGGDQALPPVAMAASAESSPDTSASLVAEVSEAPSQPIETQPGVTESKASESETSEPVTATPIKAKPVKVVPADSAASSASVGTATNAADSAETKTVWRDGAFTGYGTSRHGDIEATVVIEGGRIKSATISQCLTRYSCSWISHLQGQVVARQSPNVDYVSGATESANAFFYAVFEALLKAE